MNIISPRSHLLARYQDENPITSAHSVSFMVSEPRGPMTEMAVRSGGGGGVSLASSSSTRGANKRSVGHLRVVDKRARARGT